MTRFLAVFAFLCALAGPTSAAGAGLGENGESVAVIVGNRTYKQTTPVDFAANDAAAMKDFLVRGLGFRDENVFVLNDATLNELNQAFGSEANPQGGRLWRSVTPGRSNVFVYYSGHGVPDLKTRQPFLLPQDGDPNVAESGYALETLYRNLDLVKQKVGPDRQVIVMVDACFTGETGRKGENMLAVSAPGFAPAKPKAAAGIIKLAATSGATPANWDSETRLGLFTSRFLLGAAGLARRRGTPEGRVEWSDLASYVTREVETAARRGSGRDQTPEIDVAALSLPAVEPVPAVKQGFERARDEQLWREAEREGTREALERYVGLCGETCAYRAVAMDRLLKRRQSEEALKDHETWRRLSAEGKYRDYLDGCGKVCAYRALARGYLGEGEPKSVETPSGETPDGGSRAGLPPEEPAFPRGPAGNEEARAFEAAKAAGTIAALDAFLKARPNSAFATEARGLRAVLVKREAAKAKTRPSGRTSDRTEPDRRGSTPTDAEVRAYKPTAAEWAEGQRYLKSRQAQMQASVAPEYHRRVATQGQAAANAWLARTAHEMGRREGHEYKRRLLMRRRAAGQ